MIGGKSLRKLVADLGLELGSPDSQYMSSPPPYGVSDSTSSSGPQRNSCSLGSQYVFSSRRHQSYGRKHRDVGSSPILLARRAAIATTMLCGQPPRNSRADCGTDLFLCSCVCRGTENRLVQAETGWMGVVWGVG